MGDSQQTALWRRIFFGVWGELLLVKWLVVLRLPLFVDEAFYWQEGQHLALAYSDLPGLTAWLTRLGVEIGGHTLWGLRLPFFLLGAALPWLVIATARQLADARAAWQAGLLACLMPLSASLGLMALPDVPMAFAAALCLHAGARLLREASAGAASELALGLALGALSHYRFAAVIVVGFVVFLMLSEGRRLLRDWRVIAALLFGAAAWLPLLLWNLENADAGLRFQLVDRHPWAFHWGGLAFVPIQLVLATPLLAIVFFQMARRALRGADENSDVQWRYLALSGAISTLLFFVLGFFADSERVSFHWTMPGYLALLAIAPGWLASWSPRWQRLNWGALGLGGVLLLGSYLAIASPVVRAQLAGSKLYPANFAGWHELDVAVRERLAELPAGTPLWADNFKVGAQLGFARGNPDIPVLDHPLNHKHGRAVQLELWGLTRNTPPAGTLLVLDTDDVRFRELLQHYQQRCRQLGGLPPEQEVRVDHGARRFILTRPQAGAACDIPALAWLDSPEGGDRLPARFDVKGWAFRDGAGIARVEVLLDDQPLAVADYGLAAPQVAEYWKTSRDSRHPNVGFAAKVDASAFAAGRHWLSVRLTGNDGRIEHMPGVPIELTK